MNSNSHNNCCCGNGQSASNGQSTNNGNCGQGTNRVPGTLKVVQFFHSKEEHGIDDQQTMRKFWNCAAHKRKFMRTEGRYVDNTGALSQPTLLHFWGEWEPDSHVLGTYPKVNLMPHYLHEPFLNLNAKSNGQKTVPASNANSATTSCNANPCSAASQGSCSSQGNSYQNTDPFVFADAFYYSLCHQIRNKSKKNPGFCTTYLTSLAVGSIILFGSKVTDNNGNDAFALDTVFVVGDTRAYFFQSYKKDLAGFVPTHYDYIMGFSTKSTMFTPKPLTCYKGATPQNPVNGMFSFVPCKLAEKGLAPAFQRVIIPLSNNSGSILNKCINPKSKENFRGTPVSPSDAQAVWNEVCKAVEAQGCLRGFDFRYQLDPAIP